MSEPSQQQTGDAAPAAGHAGVSPWLRLALEAGPLVVFFITNRFYGIMVGTGAFMIATPIAVALSYKLERRIPVMPLVGCGFVMLFGGLTLWMDDDFFIKVKPTIVNLLFAAVLSIGLALKRPYLKLLMGAVLQMDDAGWHKLGFRWAVFFVVLAVINEIVWRNFSTDFWVGFKTFGLMPLTMVFALFQVPLITAHQIEQPASGD